MPEINPNCLFHADRLKFDQLEKELKQSKWISRYNYHRLASAICSCRRNLDWVPNKEELDQHTQCLRAILKAQEQKLSSILSAFIRNILDSVSPTDFSRCRLLKILYLAQKGDYNYLTRSSICKNNIETTNSNKIKSESNKLTQKQFDCMMRKKKKKLYSEVVELPIFPGNIKRLEEKLGSSLVNYSKKERFVYETKRQLNNRSFDNNVNTTYIEIWGKNQSDISSVKSCLRQKAIEAQQQAENDKQTRKAAKRQRRAYHQACLDAEPEDDFCDEGIICKDRLSEDFALKTTKDKRTGRNQVKKSVLDGGHCFHCFQAFISLKDDYRCVYHPGFILRSRWNCCGEVVKYPLDLESEHAETGCLAGMHIWRTHKKANRKPQRDMKQIIKAG